MWRGPSRLEMNRTALLSGVQEDGQSSSSRVKRRGVLKRLPCASTSVRYTSAWKLLRSKAIRFPSTDTLIPVVEARSFEMRVDEPDERPVRGSSCTHHRLESLWLGSASCNE